jgi:acetyl-CoA synthetase
VPDIAWRPTPELAAASNVGRFMAEHGITDFAALRARSIDDPEWFWDAFVRFAGIEFATPYEQVLDTTNGIEWATWFTGGALNVAHDCIDKWAERDDWRDRPAVVWEGETVDDPAGETRTLTYAELQALTDRIAHGLAARGVGEGDAVGIFLPMVPETVAAVMAVAKLGALFLPIFSGYGPEAVAVRLADGEAKALITADGTVRRGKVVPMKETADAAVALAPGVLTVVVVPRLGRTDVPMTAGRDLMLAELTALGPDEPFPTRPVPSEHPLFVAYTSGTTGRPKGAVHVHGGFLVKIAEEVGFQTDCRPDDVLFWLTDLGWIMGPWQIVGTLARGATMFCFDGAPDFPGPDRLWSMVERHRITILGVSPTLVRALMAKGDEPVAAHDLSSLRVLASTGEPWNEGPWRWFFERVGGARCPVINISGGTEVGACFLSPHVVEPIAPCSLGGASLGMAVDVVDDDCEPVRGVVGELVCRAPWPGMTRGVWKDPDRYLETYWSRWPGVWWHGDWASIDDGGQWFLHGRSDDTIKLAGKRLGPAEVETVLVEHPAVVEAAAVGLPDELKGESLACYVVLAPDAQPSDDLRAELRRHVAAGLGKSFTPGAVRFTAMLPKTRSNKIMRRSIRAVALGQEPGDLSGLEDPSALDAIGAAT